MILSWKKTETGLAQYRQESKGCRLKPTGIKAIKKPDGWYCVGVTEEGPMTMTEAKAAGNALADDGWMRV